MSEYRPMRVRLLGGVAAGTLLLTACGGGGDDGSADATVDVAGVDDAEFDDPEFDEIDDDLLSDLDDGQLEILDEALDDLAEDTTEDAAADAPWNGIRLAIAGGSAFLDTVDASAFSGATRVFQTPIGDPQPITVNAGRTVDTSAVAGGALWVNGMSTLSRVSLDDGAITETVSIDDVLPGGEFGDITGDDDGVYVIAAVPGGADLVVEVDPVTGDVRGTTDLTNEVTSLLTIASSDSHVAVGYSGAPGIPVRLIDRATGEVTDIGNYLELHDVHFVRGELWVVVMSGDVNEPSRYEKFAVDGTPLGGATLPRTGEVRVFADRAVLMEPENRADPDAPVQPIEIEPVGTPIEQLVPTDLVSIVGYAEIDGFAVSSGRCCLTDADGFPTRTAIVDISTGEVVFLADSIDASAILPPV